MDHLMTASENTRRRTQMPIEQFEEKKRLLRAFSGIQLWHLPREREHTRGTAHEWQLVDLKLRNDALHLCAPARIRLLWHCLVRCEAL